VVDQAFTGFPSAGGRLSSQKVMTTGTPVRPQFEPGDPASARMALGLDSKRPVLLVMGGSQGAAGINDLTIHALTAITNAFPELQFLHLTGENEFNKVQAAYSEAGYSAVVRPFLTEMELGMSAATLAISRAGASSLAELAAMRLPSILIPYPAATDNHQYFNARALRDAGGALLLEQRETSSAKFAAEVIKLLQDTSALNRMREELVRWHSPRAAEQIADKIMIFIRPLVPGMDQTKPAESSEEHPPLTQVQKVQPPSIAA
jgi:UDP-N-acetylglucosamine--N-acetylmuramyl-(pentapeptide) pyrophosphoryl-undecaprenol N-acetylglucosamine transferase